MANTFFKVLWHFNFNDKSSAFVNEWNWTVHGSSREIKPFLTTSLQKGFKKSCCFKAMAIKEFWPQNTCKIYLSTVQSSDECSHETLSSNLKAWLRILQCLIPNLNMFSFRTQCKGRYNVGQNVVTSVFYWRCACSNKYFATQATRIAEIFLPPTCLQVQT